MTVYTRVKEIAEQKGMSLQDVAKKAGLGINSIYGWKKKDPSISRLSAVAKVLDVSVSYLLDKDDTPEWADKKDSIDLNDFLNDNLRVNMAFDGEDLTDEEIERLKIAMTQIFWDKRKREK